MSMPNFRLDQQTALVTGAASGIGRGIALGLASAGADVACFDLPETALEEVCDEIIMAGKRAIAVPGDVMDATSWPMRSGTRRANSARSVWRSTAQESQTPHRPRTCLSASGGE